MPIGLIGFEGEAVGLFAVAIAAVMITKIIFVCGLLFIGDKSPPRIGDVLQTITGKFAALFAVLISSFIDNIGDIMDCINGYAFAAELGGCFPINNGLFLFGICIHFIIVYGLVAATLSSIYALISGLFGYGFAATDTAYDNGIHTNKPSAAKISNGSGTGSAASIPINYCNSFDKFSSAALTATVVAVTATPATNNYFERKERDRFEAPSLGAVKTTNNNLIEGLFVAVLSAIDIAIIGVFTAYFAASISTFSTIIGGVAHNNRYDFSARVAAYLPINFWAFKGLSGDLSGDLFDLFGRLLSSFIGLYSEIFAEKSVPEFGAYTTHTNYINGIDNDLINKQCSARRSRIIGGYFDTLNEYCNEHCYSFTFGFSAVLSATAVIATITTRIGFDNGLCYLRITCLEMIILFGYLAAFSAKTTTEIGFDNTDIVDGSTGIPVINEINENEYESYTISKNGNEINKNTMILKISSNDWSSNKSS